jgi:tRNA(Phe) wybutosine-synthesizing methylase Tyw3
MPGPDAFNEKKRKILQQLNQPEDEYTDLSPIGAVDANIRALVHEINDLDGYVTTSSCAGRIAVFLEGAPKAPDVDHSREPPDPSTTTTTTTASSSSQGKGGGKWLYVSHDPLDTNHLPHDGDLTALFNLPHATPPSFPAPDDPVRFIHFKFEPMVSSPRGGG